MEKKRLLSLNQEFIENEKIIWEREKMGHKFENDACLTERSRRRRAGEQGLNQVQVEEYRGILREILVHQIMGQAVHKAVISIVKTILVIGIIIAVYIAFQFEWMGKVLGALVGISTVLRFGWLWWHGERAVIRIPIDY